MIISIDVQETFSQNSTGIRIYIFKSQRTRNIEELPSYEKTFQKATVSNDKKKVPTVNLNGEKLNDSTGSYSFYSASH